MSTNTRTFTVTDAKYLGSKVAADLHQLQMFYHSPSEADINAYIDEFVILLKDGYLESVDYGFKKNGKWVLALSYEVSSLNGIDNNPGRVATGVDITGTTWGSSLRKSAKFFNLSSEERTRIENSLPIKRSEGPDPRTGVSSIFDKTYSSGGTDIKRTVIK